MAKTKAAGGHGPDRRSVCKQLCIGLVCSSEKLSPFFEVRADHGSWTSSHQVRELKFTFSDGSGFLIRSLKGRYRLVAYMSLNSGASPPAPNFTLTVAGKYMPHATVDPLGRQGESLRRLRSSLAFVGEFAHAPRVRSNIKLNI
jgi:hypothetical protein